MQHPHLDQARTKILENKRLAEAANDPEKKALYEALYGLAQTLLVMEQRQRHMYRTMFPTENPWSPPEHS